MRRIIESGAKTAKNFTKLVLILIVFCFATESTFAQCETIAGTVLESNTNEGVANVLVKAFSSTGELVDQQMSDFFGSYYLENIIASSTYRIEFVHSGTYRPAVHSAKNNTSVQFVTAPSCDVNFGLVDPLGYCADNSQIALTCFVQGGATENNDVETVVYTDYNFSLDSKVSKFANKGETGSVWGLAWKRDSRELFSSAFIKQYAGLTEHGHGAIFSTNTSTGVTKLHARLDELGQDIGTIFTDQDSSAYGAQTGKTGLGGLDISEDGETLYVINIYNNTIVSLSASNPTPETTSSITIPNPNCAGNDIYKAFALTRNGDKLLVGVTCTSFTQKDKGELSVTVFEYDITNESFTNLFSTDYPKGYWRDKPASSRKTQHWLTDLAMTDEGNMVLSLSDRVAHRYFDKITNGRLDDQHPDILLAYLKDGEYMLENNAVADTLIGSHPDQIDGEGPGGGEFFGFDYWISGPQYHSEIATGSVMVMPGDGSVVATVFDPDFDSYTGGLHKYSTFDGSKLGVGIIYEHTNDPQFGKASGLGDMVAMCADLPLEIGNLLWVDSDNNGVQDAGEAFLANIDLKLYDSNCVEVGNTSTDENGNYYFNNSNVDLNGDGTFDGLAAISDYYIVVSDEDFNSSSNTLNVDELAYALTKVNIGFGTQADVNDSDASISDDCELFQGKPSIKITTGETGNSDHSFDIGFSPAEEGDFDLALRKELKSDFVAKYGDTVEFQITVFNQGAVTAHEILINDYVAAGFTFEEDVNSGWKMDDGIAQTLIGEPLLPSAKVELTIKLIVKYGAKADELINIAEIGGAFDESGEKLDDIDSTPDNIPDNDNGGVVFQATDDEIDDDGTIDEDDHDPAAVGIFDLALRKQIANPSQEITSNSSVDFVITVFNQGSVAAESVTISDYLPEVLIFNPDINDGWELLDDSTITYLIADGISPLSSVNVALTLETGNISRDQDVINYAEIRSVVDEYGNTDSDVDSKPDGDRSNDNGGNPYDASDDEIDDNGDFDEDDHDPALLNFMIFDLALRKTTVSKSVKAGEDVDFMVTVINQGDITANSIGIVDYIPEGLTLNDEKWTMYGEDMAKLNINVADGLKSGDSVSVNIRLKVSDDFIAGTLINFAEIDHVTGMDDRDLSNSDVDSRPDDQRTNDIGGLPFSPTDNEINDTGIIDEDDHDPAYVFVFAALVSEACICLENASETEEGQFGELIEIIAPSGLEWYVHEADGLFEASIMNAGAPTGADYPKGVQYPMTEFATGPSGYMLEEYPIAGTENSEYYVIGMRQDGESYEVVVRNNIGDQEILTGNACNYETNSFEAAEGVCSGALVTYCLDDFSAGANEWTVTGDASIVGAIDEQCVDVQYGGSVGTEVSIVFNSGSANVCYSPAMATVTIGESGGTLSCLANVNISLDSDCEAGLTPEALLTTEVAVGAVYSIIYTNTFGAMLGDNIDWNNYVGKEVVAKVMDNCSGNSCWSFIKIEDKTAPEIECFDLTVSCIEMMDYNGPFVLDNCSGEATLIPGGSTQEAIDCDPDYSYRLTRTFRSQDEYGNLSGPCTQTILVERPDLDEIVGPEDRTMENGMALTCNFLDTIENGGILDPLIYGVPTLEGVPLYPSSGQFCNVGVNFKDIDFPSTGCVKKIMRQWIIFEWNCEFGELDTIIQIFNIADMEDPTITCLGDISVSSNGFSCDGTVNLPAAVVSDDCTAEPRVDITYPGGFLENSNGGTISLPLGVHEVTYTVTDDCFNSASCTIMVTVEDNTAPVAVCHLNTVLSVRTDGTTYALASSFNDGSYDDCSSVTLDVRRMDGGEACGADDEGLFSDRVEFCCADVGVEVMVVLRVTDAEMNANQCMVNVQIQDKNPPAITAPDNVTVDCLQALDLRDLSQFGDAIATDNCNDPTITEEIFSGLNECRTGIIERRFTATDGNGTATASQFILVITEDTFDINNIKWPENYLTSAACDPGALKPENLPEANGFPMLLGEGFCSQVAINYSDKVFDIINSETTCQKIIRSWIVEDFCQPLAGQGEFARWRFDQVIEISNNVAPVLTSTCEDITVCSFNENCMTGEITLTAGASDDCTPGDMMRYSYFVDLEQNGIIDFQDIGTGDSITVMGEYPIGTHSILFRFMDLCGNVVTCRQEFTIENCVKPVIVCHDGLSVGLVPMDTDNDGEVDDEMATVKARTFNASSYHPCDDDLIYSFTENPADSCITFDCDSIGLRDVTIYGITPAGVTGFCVTKIDVQDNNDVDLCRSVEDCIVMPVDITINECADDFSPETIGGGPTIDPDCICTMTTIEFSDRDSTDLNNTCTTIVRDWTVTFNCGDPMIFTSTQVITIFDSRPPILACPDNVTVNSVADACNGAAIVGIPTVLSDCTTEFTITNDSEFADSNVGAASGTYPVGLDTVIYTVLDKCENRSFCEVTILVTDNADPICDVNDITINVTDSLVDITVDPSLIDNGSFDECGMVVDRVLTPTSFGCDDAGTVQEVILTITDDSGNTTDCIAQVTVRDSVPPVCRTRTTNVNLFDDAMVTLPTNIINNGSYDLCGELVTVQIMNNGFNCERLGTQIVILRLIDDSGNITDCEQEVNVFDRGTPECRLKPITVQLDGNNEAVISGDDIDDGSFDICSGLDTLILDRTMFTCDDIGTTIQVNVTARDSSGNTIECATNVTVESGGMLMCLVNDITVYLGEDGQVDITADDVDGGSGVPCAEDAIKTIDRSMFFCNDVGIQNEVTLTVMSSLGDTSCVAMVMVLDTISPMLTCPADRTISCADVSDDLSVYGEVSTMGSNCSVLTEDINETEAFDLNDCGLGTITRTFDAMDINGNISICAQIITVTSGSSFTEENITWPLDTIRLMQCISIDPDTIDSRPSVMIPDSMCTNLGFAFDDVLLTNNANCQDTVRRTWMVIDSCPTPFNVFSYEQIIIVRDEMAPMIVVADTLFLCDTLISFDIGFADCNEVTIDYTSDAVSGTGATVSGDFPEGNTTVNITATDRCGNSSIDSVVVNIVLDTIPPRAFCISRTVIIEEDGETVVTPQDTEWFLTVSDNTTDSMDLMYSFNPEFDMSLDTFRFICDSVMLKSHLVTLYLKDKGQNVFQCTTSYVITDPNGVCTDNLAAIQGRVKTELSIDIPEVKMNLVNGDMYKMTDNTGFYNFPPMVGDAVYELRPEKNTNHMQGVTSLDLLLIQRHILGTQGLSSAYQIIAADINKTGSVTGKDLLDLRKNILGLTDAFPNNQSWRFVDEDYNFIDAANPFNEIFPESFTIYDMGVAVNKNFIGLKVGDVNGSITMKSKEVAVSRSAPIVVSLDERKLSQGELVNIPIILNEKISMAGGQMSFEISPSMKFKGISSSEFDINTTDYSLRRVDGKDILTIVIIPVQDIDFEMGSILLEVELESTGRAILSESFDLNEQFRNELYASNLEVRDVDLNVNDVDSDIVSDLLLQNTPNPWKDKTVISFDLAISQSATINVYTVTGALVTTITSDYEAGRNEVELKSNEFAGNGVFYYELVTDESRISKRMIRLK